jgi:hypothetical protein
MNTFPISLRGTTPSVGVGWVGSGEIERRENRETGRDRSFGDRIPIGKFLKFYSLTIHKGLICLLL